MSRREAVVRPDDPDDAPGQESSFASASGAVGDDQAPDDGEQALADTGRADADDDRALRAGEQSGHGRDRAGTDDDHLAGQRDQGDDGRTAATGVDAGAHDSDTARQASEQPAKARLHAAEERDEIASARDLAALARDEAAVERDDAMQRRAPHQLAQPAEHVALAAEDRRAGARDREHAATERRHACEDREALARQLAIAETDALTGARTRAAGLIELDHELDRCRRTRSLLVVAYADVVGLKALNDTDGHAAGDELLRRIARVIKEHLRPYDLMIRLGGDEFLCVMSNITLTGARQRFRQIAAALDAAPGGGSISTGFAELAAPTETATELISRADSELIDTRRANRDSR
jgi:diguanylate cyclase (GGDEF)-like protein